MRHAYLVPLFTLAALAVALPALAQGPSGTATVCLGLDGATRAPACRNGSMWRQDDMCVCPMNADQVQAPYCAPGETPAPDSHKANNARHEAARHGSLVGATFEGHRFCVRPSPKPR
jgi:hypothetical protein